MIQTDILIIGAGITGSALARELSRYNASVCVTEMACDVAEGATKANSGIVHAGFDALPGTLKAKYNVLGAGMYPDLCKALHIPYQKCGALVIALHRNDIFTLNNLLERGKQNGIPDLRILQQSELRAIEPNINPNAVAALEVPSSAIISPYETAFALADDAALNGVKFYFDEPVTNISRSENNFWLVTTRALTFSCRVIINCAGAAGAELHNMVSDEQLTMIHRRGQYYLLDRAASLPFSRTIFQCPTRMGKGVLISPTVHGNLIIGPNAEDIPDSSDTATTAIGLGEVFQKACLTWPALSIRTNITNFSGIRAHLLSDDFRVGAVSGAPGFFDAIGIESPGLSSAPAIAQDLALQVSDFLGIEKKENIILYTPPARSFCQMTDEERKKAVSENPLYGNIICRCETVTEAEIRSAIHRPVGARTIDGIKRRTRAGMGRCQGGFCSPRVAGILAEELGISLGDVKKGNGNSQLLAGTVKSFLKGGEGHD